jgi:WbqC-like protein family
MTAAVIHQPQYLPYLGFFHKLLQGDVFVVMDNVEFLRRGLQHRNKVKTNQGEQWLTVPVLHRQKQLINEVSINADFPWTRKHWQTLKTNYSPAPYFETYAQDLQHFFDREWSSLYQLNMALIQWVMDVLDIKKPIVYASTLAATGHKSELLINLSKAVGANAYLSGPGGRDYMDLSAFDAANVEVIWQEFQPPCYAQLFPDAGFLPNLSIVDVLFCCGPKTRQFLESDIKAS